MTASPPPLGALLGERAQRRQAYRVRAPAQGGPCLLLQSRPTGLGPEPPLRLPLLDLSLTGCAALRPTEHGARLATAPWCAATLELEPGLQLPVHLLAHEVTPQAGSTAPWRCSWALQRPQDEPVLQRWLTRAQLQQRQLERLQEQAAQAALAAQAAQAAKAPPAPQAVSAPPTPPTPPAAQAAQAVSAAPVPPAAQAAQAAQAAPVAQAASAAPASAPRAPTLPAGPAAVGIKLDR
jgi:hypothetical protein